MTNDLFPRHLFCISQFKRVIKFIRIFQLFPIPTEGFTVRLEKFVVNQCILSKEPRKDVVLITRAGEKCCRLSFERGNIVKVGRGKNCFCIGNGHVQVFVDCQRSREENIARIEVVQNDVQGLVF